MPKNRTSAAKASNVEADAFRAKRQICINRIESLFDAAKQAQNDSQFLTSFRLKYEKLEEYHNEFDQCHASLVCILANSDPDSLDAEDTIRENIDQIYYCIRCIYLDLVPKASHAPLEAKIKNVKLPKISLPNFDGDYLVWPSFIDLYNSLIHSNTSLSNAEKFQYLLTSLSKAPANLLKSIPVSDANYLIAYQTLVDKYQNRRKLATTYWESIVNIPALKVESLKLMQNLIDTYSENIAALKNLGFPTESWDFPLFNILIEKLDSASRTLFERLHSSVDIPTLKELLTFVRSEVKALEATDIRSATKKKAFESSKPKLNPSSFVAKSTDVSNCIVCKSNHFIYNCPQFKSQNEHQRFTFVKQNHLCLNCLGAKHSVKSCQSSSRCRVCQAQHHTLLHFPQKPKSGLTHSPEVQIVESSSTSIADEISCTTAVHNNSTIVLLSTALVEISDKNGVFHTVRALLDSGSQANFVTESCANKLGLHTARRSTRISCLGQASSYSKGVVFCTIRPCFVNTKINFEAHVLPKICAHSPNTVVVPTSWSHIENLKLADDSFGQPGPIDLLLGADLFASIMRDGRLVGKPNQPIALNTIFGWILMGKVQTSENSSVNSFLTSIQDVNLIDRTLKRFWEVEEVPECPKLSPEDIKTEEHFVATHSRDSTGRYIVSLPFKSVDSPEFRGTRTLAINRLTSLERRFVRNPELAVAYKDFMLDYISENHMEPVEAPSVDSGPMYYVPHHCVMRPDSVTSKIRVVFDGSAKDVENKSLNETLSIGPKFQNDLVAILLKFRLHAVALTGDIKQMYRQVLVDSSYRNYQRIVWRFSDTDPIQDYLLRTVTYGLTSAPYLAIRALHQLAEDENQFTLASTVLKTDIYVDDVVSGSNTVENALLLKQELLELCSKGGFVVRKWASNRPELLSVNTSNPDDVSFNFDDNFVLKILGLKWKPSLDLFSYQISISARACTKRAILSDLARTFDPLGFLAPVTFFIKRFIQHLWTLGLEWDEEPPAGIIEKWEKFKSDFLNLTRIELPRYLLPCEYNTVELHGFSDASEAGYAAVVYLRFVSSSSVSVKLICAKSKVSPLKRISIPRLELCGAYLLAKLLSFVYSTYSPKLCIGPIFAWTDSSVALTWIRSSPHRWKCFVSNRVTSIQELVPPNLWHYVKSVHNPSDCASRGLKPSELVEKSIWWNGPEWLSCSQSQWPQSRFDIVVSEFEEEERKISLLTSDSRDSIELLLEKFSSLSKTQRIIAYCFRFAHNCKNKTTKIVGPLVANELDDALMGLVKFVQQSSFEVEIARLEKNQPVCKSLRKLSPFLDEAGVLRVGGRLSHSSLPYMAKHPALLPRSNRLTELIIVKFHNENLHPGPQTLHYLLSCQFWILSGKRAIRSTISNCYRCFRVNPRPLQPLMGDLPACRVQQVKPFSSVGVDYAGPFSLTMGRIRGAKVTKGYLCLFVCMATKALHLELASDLTSDAFLGALRRFVARRGRCQNIYSDCGTNFVGTSRHLNSLMSAAVETERIAWSFNPPSGPHFGGLWEAGVKSVKTHLLRVVGDQVMTYEELSTLFSQIEALLNSRPLTPLSADPNDLSVLTPGHFLTLEPLTAVPEKNLDHLKINRLTRWQLIQKMHSHFWSRWHSEYLHTLQQRQKWFDSCTNIQEGTLVLIKSELQPPLQWALGRVISTQAGRDGIVRVATVRTANTILKRPVTKLCPLPNQH